MLMSCGRFVAGTGSPGVDQMTPARISDETDDNCYRSKAVHSQVSVRP